MTEKVHQIDMPAICERLRIPLRDVAISLGFSSEKPFYKWRYPKEFGEKSTNAARPDYETILQLLSMGVTHEELFGIDCVKMSPQDLAPEHTTGLDGPQIQVIQDFIRNETGRMFNEEFDKRINVALGRDQSKAVG